MLNFKNENVAKCPLNYSPVDLFTKNKTLPLQCSSNLNWEKQYANKDFDLRKSSSYSHFIFHMVNN